MTLYLLKGKNCLRYGTPIYHSARSAEETVVQRALQLNEVNLHNFGKWDANLANQECDRQGIRVVLSSATESSSTPGSSESVLEVAAN